LGHAVIVQAVEPGSAPFGRVCGVRRDPAPGMLYAGSGPAWNSAAAGW
jgi:hypothetical protein